MKRFLFPISALLLAVLSVVSFGSSSVSAVSSYDNIVNVASDLVINKPSWLPSEGPSSVDVSLDWYNQAHHTLEKQCSSNPSNCGALNALELIIQSETSSWLVLKYSDAYQIYVTNDPSAHLEFFMNDTTPSLRIVSSANDVRNLQFFNYTPAANGCYSAFSSVTSEKCIYGSGTLTVSDSVDITGDVVAPGGIFLSTLPITYPDGYEGDIIPETYDPPLVNDSTPDFYIVSSVNGLVTIRDRRFNTFDNVPFTCDDGLTPYIRYTLQDLDHYLIFDTGGFSPTVDYQFQLPVKNEIINYEFSGRYDCGENTEPSFPNSSSVQFQLDPLGGLKTDLFEECISQDFPFLHYEACYENVMRMLNMLSFSALKINGWTYNAQCRQLTVLGGWLGTQPGQVICPNFSAQVRNTVTPFVAFFLGLTMFGFVVRMRGNT